MKFACQILFFIAACASGFTAELKRERWHVPNREYEEYDSVAVPVIDFALIQKIHTGMSFEEVKKITGFSPIDYTIHPAYAILGTEVDHEYYEVAFLHTKDRVVEAISFRPSPWKKKANKTPQTTPGLRPSVSEL